MILWKPLEHKKEITLAVLLLIAGFWIGTYWGGDLRMAICARDFTFIDPVYACGSRATLSKTHPAELVDSLKDFAESELDSGRLSGISIFFRDLKAGPTFSVNEQEEFIPASLMKMPLAIAYLRVAEEDPDLLRTKITYNGKNETAGVSQTFKPSSTAQAGEVYTIEDLLRMMISSSDNISQGILHKYMGEMPGGKEVLYQTYRELGFVDPKNPYSDNAINTHTYASVFRILYNSSYLNSQSSEKLLSWLANSDFADGLERGVPEGMEIAHKFGERDLQPSGQKQLHDCGIVYYPGNPYVLCVMTKGTVWANMQDAIGSVSRLVYDEVDSRKLK